MTIREALNILFSHYPNFTEENQHRTPKTRTTKWDFCVVRDIVGIDMSRYESEGFLRLMSLEDPLATAFFHMMVPVIHDDGIDFTEYYFDGDKRCILASTHDVYELSAEKVEAMQAAIKHYKFDGIEQ